MKVGLWSTTAASNNATPPDGLPEGQVCSSFNDSMREMMASVRTAVQDMDFFDHGMSPTYVSANSFTVTGDQTARLNARRPLKLFCGGNTIYRSIQTASFTAVTTVQLASGTAVTNSLSSFAVGVFNPTRLDPPAGAYVTFYFINGLLSIGQSYNVSSVSLSATADVRITFTTPLATAGYVSNIYIPSNATGFLPVVRSYSAAVAGCNFAISNNIAGNLTAAEVNCVFFGG